MHSEVDNINKGKENGTHDKQIIKDFGVYEKDEEGDEIMISNFIPEIIEEQENIGLES